MLTPFFIGTPQMTFYVYRAPNVRGMVGILSTTSVLIA